VSRSSIVSYHDCLPDLTAQLSERGAIGMLGIDAGALGEIEYEYGTAAYEEVRGRLFDTLGEQRGKDYRLGDRLCVETPFGLRFVLFLEGKRRRSVPLGPADLKAVRTRLLSSLVPQMARATFPYLKAPPPIEVGFGIAIHNPLVHPDRIFSRAIKEVFAVATHLRRSDELSEQERVQDLIVRERVVTAYQPILDLADNTGLGHEALSRGARGTGFEAADTLFDAATRHGLLVELDRLCRKRALLNSGRIPSTSRLFLNTLPATIRDPQFRGKQLIDFLDTAQVAPNRIVIEITEKLVIENYGLFREAMAYFTDLGMAFAVDDVGAGYSGLESIARLKPSFLKIDMMLVRDVHISLVNREMVKAIVSLGVGIGADVIAEGIHGKEEVETLRGLGVRYGQGYFLARPEAAE